MSDEKTTGEVINVNEIKKLIPHRFPLLLVDQVRDVIPHVSAVGIKNVTINEDHFNGHFPTQPVMPGVMIVEAMAQTAAVLVAKSLGDLAEDSLVYFLTIDKCKFRTIVSPPDQVELHVSVLRGKAKIWRFKGEAKVNGEVVTEAEFAAMIVPPEEVV